MNRYWYSFIIFCLVSIAFPVDAARFSGNYLLQVCASDKSGKEVIKGGHAACQAYIAGVVDYHTIQRSLGTQPTVDFCLPDALTLAQMQMIVSNYLRKNKQHDDFIATPAIAMALYEIYPCPKRKK